MTSTYLVHWSAFVIRLGGDVPRPDGLSLIGTAVDVMGFVSASIGRIVSANSHVRF
jgi:hypothetical protein